jgi:hypothetical protein
MTVKLTRGPGQPRKIINPAYLREALNPKRNITIKRLAKALNVNRSTLYSYMDAFGVSRNFAELSENDMEDLMRTFRKHRPQSGLKYAVAYVRSKGLRVQRRRIRRAVNRVDRIGHVLRRHETIQRREYKNPRPNALWHMDGYHKLIRWGFVLHGIVDGFCRTVCVYPNL